MSFNPQNTKAMKKLVVVFSLLFGISFVSNAQEDTQIVEQDLLVRSGSNSIVLKNGLGTFRFIFRNGQIMNPSVQATDGKIMRFEDGDESTTGTPNPGCKDPKCARYIYNKETMSVIILCMPCDLTIGGPTPTAAIAIPAFMKNARKSK